MEMRVDPATIAGVTELVRDGRMAQALKILQPVVAEVVAATSFKLLNASGDNRFAADRYPAYRTKKLCQRSS